MDQSVVDWYEYLNQNSYMPDQAFSKLLFSWVLPLTSPRVYSPWVRLQLLLILFPCYLSIQHFWYIISVSIFYNEIVLFPFHQVVYLFLYSLHQLDGRIFFMQYDLVIPKELLNIRSMVICQSHGIKQMMRVKIASRAISRDIPDPLSPPLSIVHSLRQVFWVTSHIGTELLYVVYSWSSWCCSSMWRGPQEYIHYELVPTSPVVFHMYGNFRHGR